MVMVMVEGGEGQVAVKETEGGSVYSDQDMMSIRHISWCNSIHPRASSNNVWLFYDATGI